MKSDQKPPESNSAAATPSQMREPVVAVVMGVSGSGKTTIAALLADMLGCEFVEGDDLHSPESVEKMRNGEPLTTADRLPWLHRVASTVDEWLKRGSSGVITCSALKRSYRDIIVGGRSGVKLVYLRGSYELISSRIAERHSHFMPAALLRSQFDELEEPGEDEPVLVVGVDASPQEIAADIVDQLQAHQSL